MNTGNLHNFHVIGISYKTADPQLRGQFAVNNDQYARLLESSGNYSIEQAFIVSTCNRTEVYAYAENTHQIAQWLCSETEGNTGDFQSIAYEFHGRAAIDHLFKVATGLDSQILGDFEILGQIKTAVKFSKEHNCLGPVMERMLNTVSQAAKAVKTHTGLSSGTVSVSFAAVQYIREHIESIGTKKIALIGTGKIGRTTCRNLVDYLHTNNITLINRTYDTAVQLADELNLSAAPIEDLESIVDGSDVILVSSSAPEPIITKSMLANKGAKLLIDLSIPKNIAADVSDLEGISLIDVDSLSKIKDETLQNRKAEVPKAEGIISAHIQEFLAWHEQRKYVPVIKEVTEKLRAISIPAELLNVSSANGGSANGGKDDKIQKIVNNFASRMRQYYSPGCHCLQAISDYIA